MGSTLWLFLKTWVLPILTFGITLPVWLFLAAGVWLWADKDSAVRQAVDKATSELVAGARLDALEAELVEERRLRAWSDGKADEAQAIAEKERAARETLQTQATLSEAEKRTLQEELDAIALDPNNGGRVSKPFYDGLRAR